MAQCSSPGLRRTASSTSFDSLFWPDTGRYSQNYQAPSFPLSTSGGYNPSRVTSLITLRVDLARAKELWMSGVNNPSRLLR